MPKCPRCQKEVYFAEKVSSLGKDWHRPCLRCEKCNKTLSSGGHAEHDGKPYCNIPCYSALFGPKGFGHGGTESHAYQPKAKMPKCPNCNKEVYFAEKVTSLGKDWHRPCLKCEKCKKTLSAGSHAEKNGKPYCHKPCYAALFGPGGFGHGGTESHKY
ncbi:cysteine-rich protein 2-like [Actinia tenebrosa]|uniref:Cysteine-rich protein 2-like n=1 Tax=Actinia tenebrosa TaxID=6105 RepID=A0A6P8I2K4_ACTTE|nr:cysteine-rich protein 2-like [Actinia tenebrosa]